MRQFLLLSLVLALCLVGATEGLSTTRKPLKGLLFRLAPARGWGPLEKAFWDVSTPGSKNFRKFLPVSEIADLVAPPTGAVESTIRVLEAQGCTRIKVEPTGDIISAAVPWTHSWSTAGSAVVDGKRQELTAMPTVPQELSKWVESVIYTNVKPHNREGQSGTFTLEEKRRSTLVDLQSGVSCQESGFPGMCIDIYTMRSQYNYSWEYSHNNSAANAFNYSQAVAEFEQEQFYHKNVAKFNEKYPPLPTDPMINTDGPNSGGYFGEGNLDLEYIGGMNPGVTTWWVADNEFSLTKFSQKVLNLTTLPGVVSISWGSGEQGFEKSSIDSDNKEFMKMGTAGISVFASAGDKGTGSTGFFSCGTFNPTWPATSPYVTAVGATYMDTNQSQEVSWKGSGGGFSSLHTMPDYQSAAVNGYLNHSNVSLPKQKYWTRGGRAIPDVASLGCNAMVYSSGWGPETGTSVASPSFAGMISEIVVHRQLAGKGTLGFINPALYKLGTAGIDITEGDNKSGWCKKGFEATTGWDPISGLGTANFPFLFEHLSKE